MVEEKFVVSTITFSAALYVMASPVSMPCSVLVMVLETVIVVVLIVIGSGLSKYAVTLPSSPPVQ